MIVDYAIAAKFNALLGAFESNIPGIWITYCQRVSASNVVISVTLGGTAFVLQNADFVTFIWPNDSTWCYAPFQGSAGTTDNWVLGGVFLRKWYTLYDYNHQGGAAHPRIGFAQSL
jgi:hypothetical protein